PISHQYVLLSCSCTPHTLPFFFFHATPTTEIYTLSLHDALPISARQLRGTLLRRRRAPGGCPHRGQDHPVPGRVLHAPERDDPRSEEHTSELQSRGHLVCRLLLEKKKKNNKN